MDNERNASLNEASKSNWGQKSLFVLKTNLNVNAVSFASANLSQTRIHRSNSLCSARHSHSNGNLESQFKDASSGNPNSFWRGNIHQVQNRFSNTNCSYNDSSATAVSSMNNFPRGLVMSCNPRIWRNISCRNVNSSIVNNDSFRQRAYRRGQSESNLSRGFRPIVLPNGIIQISLRDGIKIDITLDKAVRVTNVARGIDVSVSSNGQSSAVKHPNGKVNQYNSVVEIVTYDGTSRNDFVRYAKFWQKGISFTSSSSALVYRIDSGGVRSTGDTLTDLMTEHTISVFLTDSRHGTRYFEESMTVAHEATHVRNTDGTEDFFVNGFRITQKPYGVVKIHRLDHHCIIGVNSAHTSITITTSEFHCTAALRDTPHLFVRRAAQRVHFDGCCFLVRFDGNSAGFDNNNRLKVY